MTPDNFFEMVGEFHQICLDTLGAKNKEYARNNDKLHNFKRAGQMDNCTPEKALKGMLTKHLVSIYDMVEDIEHDGLYAPLSLWDEKLKDAVNYFYLLRGLIVESRKGEQQ